MLQTCAKTANESLRYPPNGRGWLVKTDNWVWLTARGVRWAGAWGALGWLQRWAGAGRNPSCRAKGMLSLEREVLWQSRGFAKSIGVLRMNCFKLAVLVDACSGKTVYLIWSRQTYFHSQICFISTGRITWSFEGLACWVLQAFSCTGIQSANLSCIGMSEEARRGYVMCWFNTDGCFLNPHLLSDGEMTCGAGLKALPHCNDS